MLLPASHGLRQKSVRVVPEGITFAPHLIEQPRRCARVPYRARLKGLADFARPRFPPLLGFPPFPSGRRSVDLAYEIRCSRRQTC